MSEVAQLQARIDDATRDIERSYENSLKTVREMKEKINDLELSNSRKGHSTRKDSQALSSAINALDGLTDSLILRSEKVEEEYETLEQECRTHMLQPARMNDLRTMCGKTKELAMNLLCFSLAHFKREK